MASDIGKIAIGVGCGILIAVGVLLGTCAGCAAMFTKSLHDTQVEEREALSAVDFEDVTAERSSSGYVTIKGRVRNKGTKAVSSLKIGFHLLAKDGTVLDTAYDYPLMGSPLAPGDARQFSRTMRWPRSADKYEYYIEP